MKRCKWGNHIFCGCLCRQVNKQANLKHYGISYLVDNDNNLADRGYDIGILPKSITLNIAKFL